MLLELFQDDALENFEDRWKNTDCSNVSITWEVRVFFAKCKNFGFFAVVGDCSKFPPPVEAALELG